MTHVETKSPPISILTENNNQPAFSIPYVGARRPKSRPLFHPVELRSMKACRQSRFAIERKVRARRAMRHGESVECCLGVEVSFLAKVPVPAVADRDMTDFVAQNHIENFDRLVIARCCESPANAWRDIEATGFHDPRNERHAGENVSAGGFRHVPKSIVGGIASIRVSVFGKIPGEESEMAGLFGCDAEPVAIVLRRHVAKSIAGVECEVNGIEFEQLQRRAWTNGHTSSGASITVSAPQ